MNLTTSKQYFHQPGIGFLSHVGAVRNENQDSFGFDLEKSLFVVADGMGGHKGGALASKIAVQSILENFSPGQGFDRSMIDAIDQAHQNILSQQLTNNPHEQMGTTAVVVHTHAHRAYIYWVGDSRCYHYAHHKKNIAQKTKDHSVVQELIDLKRLSPEDAPFHPQKHIITKALGIGYDRVTPSSIQLDMADDDRLIICSDGLSNEIEEFDLLRVCQKEKAPQKISEALVSLALDRGGRDNVTVVCISSDWDLAGL